MPDLMVQLNGQTVPLKDCVWIDFRSCGCPCGALNAAGSTTAYGTEEQARREFCPTKREQDKAAKQGFYLELMTFDRYRDEIDLLASCDTCKPKRKAA